MSDGFGGSDSDSLSVACLQDTLDCDGDDVVYSADCAPNDAGAFAIPGEVPLLRVARGAADSSMIDWDDASSGAGTGTRYDVVGGQIAELWRDRDFGAVACVTQDVLSITSVDGRPLPAHVPGFPADGWYYLVRAQNACGASDYGWGSFDRRPIDPALCD